MIWLILSIIGIVGVIISLVVYFCVRAGDVDDD